MKRAKEAKKAAEKLRKNLRKKQRAQLKKAKAQALAPKRKAAAKRRVKYWVALLIVCILLLLDRCQCAPKKPAPPPKPAPVQKKVAEKKTPPAKLKGRYKKDPRPKYKTPPKGPQSWLGAFRLQVGARSERLARCVEGASNTGALRWSVTVDPQSGNVSQHLLETHGDAPEISKTRRQCLLNVLSDPSYTIVRQEGDSDNPERVSLVVEF